MDSIIDAAIKIVTEGGAAGLSVLGWMLFFIERYYVIPRREKEFREDLNTLRRANADIADRTTDALAGMKVILEVVKDRLGRE